MKYVTRKLLKFRPGSEYVGSVRYEPRGNPERECYNNAIKEFEETAQKPVAGWVIGPMDENGYTDIFWHYWNKDNEGRYYDTTPFPGNDRQDYDFVKDNEIPIEMMRLQTEGYYKDKSGLIPCMKYYNNKFQIEDLRKKSKSRYDLNQDYSFVLDSDESVSIEGLIKLSHLDGEVKVSDTKTQFIF